MSTVYADIHSPLFGQFHRTVSSTARGGRTSYRLRYRPTVSEQHKPLVVNGYGVELALKRTDYIVIDDRDSEKEKDAVAVDAVDPQADSLETRDLADLKPLSSSELLGLGLKASSFIMASQDPFDALVKVSQDFPKHSSFISKLNILDEFVVEHRSNREKFLPAGYNMIWMNGLQIEERQIDAFALLEQLRQERKLIGSLKDVGLSGAEAVSLISHPAIAQSQVSGEVQRYDYRDTLEGGNVIIWLNDIEKDRRYESWPPFAGAVCTPKTSNSLALTIPISATPAYLSRTVAYSTA